MNKRIIETKPLSELIYEWISEEPRDIDEICRRFNINKRQAEGAIGYLRKVRNIKSIPPPKYLTKYGV